MQEQDGLVLMEQTCNFTPREIEAKWIEARKIIKGDGSEGGREDACNTDLQIIVSLEEVLCGSGSITHTYLAPVII